MVKAVFLSEFEGRGVRLIRLEADNGDCLYVDFAEAGKLADDLYGIVNGIAVDEHEPGAGGK